MGDFTQSGKRDPFDQPAPLGYPTQHAGWMPAGAPPPARSWGIMGVLLVLGLIVLGVAYGLTVFLTRAAWVTAEPHHGVRITYAARTQDGSSPSAAAMAETQKVVQSRVDDLGDPGSRVVVDDGRLLVTVPSAAEHQARAIAQSGQLYLRPVIHAIPAQSTPETAPPVLINPSPPPGDLAQRVTDEKALRQSSDRQIQILALQYQATRCSGYDVLTDNDDPNSPLVTCSQDGKQALLLDKSIIAGSQIENATAGFDEGRGIHVIDLQFDADATKTWSDYTAANVGTQTAFTLDTRVVSAPEINEAIPGGRTQVTGLFDGESARDIATALRHGALPLSLSFESSTAATIPAAPASTPLRVGLIAGGFTEAVLVIVVSGYLIRQRRRASARGPVSDGQYPAT